MSQKVSGIKSFFQVGAIVLVVLTMLGQAETASACSAEPLIGSVCFTAIGYCPSGYLPTDGRVLDVRSYQALFALLGNRYGGDGKSTFGLPDLRGRAPIGTNNSSITTGGTKISATPLATLRGQETMSLVTANLPPAGSSGGPAKVAATTNEATTNMPGSSVQLAVGNVTPVGRDSVTTKIYAPIGGTQVELGGVSGGDSSSGGNSTPFGIVSPQLALTACIATEGIWPQNPN